MKIQRRSIIFCTLLGSVLQFACFAQQDPSSSSNSSDVTAPTQTPSALQGEAPVVLNSNAEHSSQVIGGIGFSGLYDDNASGTSSNRLSDSEYSILPEIGVQFFQLHTAWDLHYDGGYNFDQRASVRDSMTHEGLLDVQHQFSPRLSSELRENYLISTDPFATPGAGGTLPSFQGLGQLNTFTTTPLAQRTASISYAAMSYQLTEHSSIGASGNFSVEHYRDVAGSAFNA